MARFTIGCVPYVNAIPLIHPFIALGKDSPIQVRFDVPSKLPSMLDSGQADAVLVSIFDPLTVPGRRLAQGVGIGSDGPVRSVRVFSKVPLDQITTLALDSSSMTSNALAKIILAKRYAVKPSTTTMEPNLDAMLGKTDACVLIGDAGMASDSDHLFVADLGLEWQELCHLPFVWAGWVGNEGMTVELADLLSRAYNRTDSFQVESGLEAWIEMGMAQSDFGEARLREYFQSDIRFELDEGSFEGMRHYARLLNDVEHVKTYLPDLIGSSASYAQSPISI